MSHLIAITLAYGLDRLFGDPKGMPHPVIGMGKLISFFEKFWNQGRGRKIKGGLMGILVIGFSFFFSFGLVELLAAWNHYVAIGLEAVLIWTTIAEKGLRQASMDVYRPLKEGDFPRARNHLSYIVGRDTDHLEEAGIARGTVETVAENISDGVTAPLFYALIGGAPLAMAYRAVNTCDSMVGYKNARFKEFGFISAKLDDLFNLIPSRLTAFVMIISSTISLKEKQKLLRELPIHARRHPSPNSGWGEAAAALVLGVQLGGINYYFGERSERPTIGNAVRAPMAYDIEKVNYLLSKTVWIWILLLCLGGMGIELAFTWSESD
ncbi:adenosylcobinamide-phosphate synthase CbiB [Halobacillus mangrovi]|uniref:adenosylcobinamide-phosphate synthase CbiB n=1 Tax=Halobacillus mangrovi TaxID=402384 RepID=UPI003D95BF18